MSGTSLDGLDAALCSFSQSDEKWNYHLHYADTVPYPADWKNKLSGAFTMSGRDLTKLDIEYGKYIGSVCNKVFQRAGKKADLISSHGHTVFHDPAFGYTLQIGHGANIAFETGIPVVCNFRVADVAAGGQGAPLAPVGDHYLFNQYQACLNLGGFANISFEHNYNRIAFDICPVNIVLNHLAQKAGREYDINGELAKEGKVSTSLITKLNKLGYYKKKFPKSLGREWLEKTFLPIVDEEIYSLTDQLRTLYQHITGQIVLTLNTYGIKNVMLTGGGTHNKFLTELIKQHSDVNVIIPDDSTINFKEAIIFAFLGLLRTMNKINCFSSVTGAVRDTSTGIIYLP